MKPVEHHVRLTRLIRAPREQVYNAWIDPETRMQWWSAQEGMICHLCEIDASTSGKYRCGMQDEQGNDYIAFGEFLELSPYHRLSFTWNWEHAPSFGADSRVTIELHEAEFDGQPATELVLLHELLASPHERSEHTVGWLGVLRVLGSIFGNPPRADEL